MITHLTYAVSFSAPTAAQRETMSHLYPTVDERWHQKMDRALAVVTVHDGEILVATGLVHDSVIAPTSELDALELGSMAVRPDYRRLGIRQRVSELRLRYALQAGGTPITVISSANPASWAYYERSDLWDFERSFEQAGEMKFIYRASNLARDLAAAESPLVQGVMIWNQPAVPMQQSTPNPPVLEGSPTPLIDLELVRSLRMNGHPAV